MGYTLSWIAARDNSSDKLNNALQLRASGVREDFAESDCTSARLPSGYYLVIFKREELSRALLSDVSRSVPLLYGWVEEHVMYSTVAAWEQGKEHWAIVHDAQNDIMDLQVRGTPPERYHVIRDRLFAEQAADGGENAEVDHIFDIPVDLAYELIGYRYDKDIDGMDKNGFQIMEREKKPAFWARLLGKK